MKLRSPRRALLLAGALFVLAPVGLAGIAMAQQAAIVGNATVSEGDVLRFGQLRVRLWGVDAPERDQRCGGVAAGQRASEALLRAVEGRRISCTVRSVDAQNRPVAVCTTQGRDIGATLVSQGWAWNYGEGEYQSQEADARRERLGVHRMNCEMPWAIREREQRRTGGGRAVLRAPSGPVL